MLRLLKPNPKDESLSMSNLRLANEGDNSIVSESNLSDTHDIQEFPENSARAGKKILEEMNSSTNQHFGDIPSEVMALPDDSRNDSIATAGPQVTSTPARPSTSSDSSASSHSSMPPLELSATQDSGHSSASDASDTVFAHQLQETSPMESDME